MNKIKIFLAVAVCSIFIHFLDLDISSAQNMTIETIPPEVDESGHTTEERIDQIVITLRILAGVVLVGTLGYWWHTKPKESSIGQAEDNETAEIKPKDKQVDPGFSPWSKNKDGNEMTDSESSSDKEHA